MIQIYTDAKEIKKGEYILGYISKDGELKGNRIAKLKDNNEAELYALEMAIYECAPFDKEITFLTDSMSAVNHFQENKLEKIKNITGLHEITESEVELYKMEHVKREKNIANMYVRAVSYS